MNSKHKSLRYFFFVLLFSISCTSTISEDILIGEWDVTITIPDEESVSGDIIFFDTSTYELKIDDEIVEGEFKYLMSNESSLLIELELPNFIGEEFFGSQINLPLLLNVNDDKDRIRTSLLDVIKIRFEK